MTDIPKVKRNIKRLIDAGVPEAEIDAYVASEGVSIEQLQAQPGGAPYDPMKTLENLPGSAYEFGKAMVQPFIHPIETAKTVGDLGVDAVRKIAPQSAQGYIPDVNPDVDTAGAFGQFYKGRYGSWDGFKRAAEEDPVGIIGDAATVFTGGGALLPKVGTLGKIGNVARTTGAELNPLTQVSRLGRATTKVGKEALGMTTGTSADTIGEAYRAGKAGGQQGKAFRDNLRGKEPQEAVLDEAHDAIGNISDTRGQQYRQDMRSIKANTTPIDMTPIVKKFNDLSKDAYHGGHQKYSDATMNKLAEIRKVVDEWYGDPSVQNAGGLDALKQRIDDLMPPVTEKNGQASRIVTTMRNAVKDEIVKQAPDYATAMKNYESSKSVQTELERSLSLGKRASADTTLRKLQSVTRNNANTNYGSRVNNAKTLEAAGAKTLMPRLAGQALNTWMPRGFRGPGSSIALASGLGYFLSPWALPALLAGSPRLVGEATHLAGRAAKPLSRVPRPSRGGLLGARALGSVGLLGQQ